jgi:signal transduction histidine kinase
LPFQKLNPVDARQKLLAATRLHFIHWIVIPLSFLLSFVAWHYAKTNLDAGMEARFDREADQITALVQHRMKNYEDALWGGVAMIRASGGDVAFDKWRAYADSIDVPTKYPGINGLGVIHSVHESQMDDFLAEQRKLRPDYAVHRKHDGADHFPISYIVPVAGNEQAVGLDIAHESNRRIAAKRAVQSGTAQITGPITLVQDNSQTPGFLFYTPFYNDSVSKDHEPSKAKQKSIAGLVYAPFVVKKLMDGALEKSLRNVGMRLVDNQEVLYDEHVASDPQFDPSPLFSRMAKIELYGRTWTFDIRSAMSFRESSHSSQPMFILLGGIVIDCLLVVLFVSISRSSRTALDYADSMTQKLETSQGLLQERAMQLERSNQELEQFAFIASHDLQEPLRKVGSFCDLIKEEYGDRLGNEGNLYLDYAMEGATRMRSLVQDLLQYSKFNAEPQPLVIVDTSTAVSQAISNLEFSISQAKATVTYDELPKVQGHERGFIRLFQNLIGNGIKYRSKKPPNVHLEARELNGCWEFTVSDNGIGISPEYSQQVFGIFKRLHSRSKVSGNGIGLAICKRIVEGWNGKIWIASHQGTGCRVCFTVPKLTDHQTAAEQTRYDIVKKGDSRELLATSNA